MHSRPKAAPGYPAQFYRDRFRSWLWLILIPLSVLGAFAACFMFTVLMGARNWLQYPALAFVLWAIYSIIKGQIRAWKDARIYPYYNKHLPHAGTYLRGQSILRNLHQLDGLAEQNGIKTISSYGFPDALRKQIVIWHDASDGLQTVTGLIKAVAESPHSFTDAAAIQAELEIIRLAFEKASSEGIKFSFLIESMGGTNGMVWEIRKGSP